MLICFLLIDIFVGKKDQRVGFDKLEGQRLGEKGIYCLFYNFIKIRLWGCVFFQKYLEII